FHARFLRTVGQASWMVVVFLAPVLAGVGAGRCAPATFYVAAVLTLVPSGNDPMNPAKERLAQDLAAQAGLVLRNVALVEDLRESRRRIVTTQDERARRLERDIHDGAQQQLVALAVKARLAQNLAERDPERLTPMLAEIQEGANDALENLRDLARGIYPPLLADQGLLAAIDAQARKAALPVNVSSDSLGRYPEDVEAAVYFCVLEALNNVAKYAEANTVEVRLASDDSLLRFEVADDGVGFDAAHPGAAGTGLQGMADRLEALGGTLSVTSEPGDGTTVRGEIPA
ncbi:MAG: histidine kinase, partial [Actinomycetota bacterium]